MSRFDGKNVFITGAGSGFGRRTALRFAEEGAKNLYLVDYQPDRLEAVVPQVEELGATAHAFDLDMGVYENCKEAIARALAVDPKLDVMIANAAAWHASHILEHSWEQWRRVLSVNLDAYFVLGQEAANGMKETGGGVLLFTSSIVGQGHGREFTSYNVSKAGVMQLSKAFAVECAPFNIRSNTVAPGPADTQQSVDLVGEELMEKWRTEGFPVVPLGTLAEDLDIAEAFLYLASDAAKYVSGIDLIVDGALTAQTYDVPED